MKKPLEFFLELTKIPRDSGDEKAVSEYLMAFANERGLDSTADEAYNVVIKKPGTPGYTHSPVLVMQSHSDMVYVKTQGSTHDYYSPLIVKEVDGCLTAEGTSLGADNGMGIAFTLSLLDSSDIPHPPLEALFTSSEEIGMLGAARLKPGAITGRRMINLDNEEEGVFTAGCAGGASAIITLNSSWDKPTKNSQWYELSVSGLLGGHSGVEIHKGRGNAIQLLARVLRAARETLGANVGMIEGGLKSNAIPCAANAAIAVADGKKLNALVQQMSAAFKKELAGSDADVSLGLTACAPLAHILTDDALEKMLFLLLTIPNGVQTMSMHLSGLVESSNNIGIIRCDENAITTTCAPRSAISTLKTFICQKINLLAAFADACVVYEGDYPEWEFAPVSPLRDKAAEVYTHMYGKPPRIEMVHGGLECGYFKAFYPDMDILSTGCTLSDLHTPNETLDIASANRVWEWLQALMGELK